jgi:hypothetical protein
MLVPNTATLALLSFFCPLPKEFGVVPALHSSQGPVAWLTQGTAPPLQPAPAQA